MRTIFICAALACLSVVTGCDFGEQERRERERREAEEAKVAARSEQELTRYRAVLSTLVRDKIKSGEERRQQLVGEIAELRKDIADFQSASSSCMSEKDAAGVELPLENRLLHLMKNETVKALATKYLATDFSRDAASFIERIRVARADEKRYRDALRKNDELYAQNVAESEKWAKMTTAQRDAEISRLRRELSSLEAKRKEILKDVGDVTRHSLQGSVRAERERYEHGVMVRHKLDDLDTRIKDKRYQIDYLRNPAQHQSFIANAVGRTQDIQHQANRNRQQALDDIESQFKPKQMAHDVAIQYEQQTVAKLQEAMAERLTARSREDQTLRERLEDWKGKHTVIPISTLAELQQIRRKLER